MSSLPIRPGTPFNVVSQTMLLVYCPEGQVVNGTRENSAQEIICKDGRWDTLRPCVDFRFDQLDEGSTVWVIGTYILYL